MLQLSGRQMRPMKRLGDPDITKYWSDWQPKNFFCQSPTPIVPDNATMLDVWLSNYAYFFPIFLCRTTQNLCGPSNVPTEWSAGRPRFFSLAAALITAWQWQVEDTDQILTHWGQDKINAISQRTFSNVFSRMKMFEFLFKFHWWLFPSRVGFFPSKTCFSHPKWDELG